MNKKFLSAILFGALMVTSTGTFVSCKDYDDDIKDLQEKVDKLATKEDMASQIATLQAALTTAAKDASDAITKATAAETAAKAAGDDAAAAKAAAEKSVAEAKAAAIEAAKSEVATAQAALEKIVADGLADNKTEMDKLRQEIAKATESVEAIIGSIADMVTSVELVESYSTAGQGHDLSYNVGLPMTFTTAIEKDNVFETGIANAITFVKDTQVQTPDKFVVRVSPTNAVLTPDMISLVNSQGKNLDDMLAVKSVEKFTGLLSRAASNNGLWEVTVALKEYNKDAFTAATVPADNQNKKILFAVQVNNTLSTAAERYVTSSYDLSLGWTPYDPASTLNYFVDDTNVSQIRNRYTSAEDGTAAGYTELAWNSNGPAVKPIKTGADANVVTDATDNRNNPVALHPAVQGTPITISLTTSNSEIIAPANIRGLYVTLDYKANAVESAPSEWNAWNSYSYTGLNAVVEGTTTQITINNTTAINDIIGFRVYAVNYDGTLVDPDGKAFYVSVGGQVVNSAYNTTWTWKANGSSEISKEAVAEGVFNDSWINSVASVSIQSDSVSYGSTSNANSIPLNAIKYYKADKTTSVPVNAPTKDIKYVTIDHTALPVPAYWYDDNKTYSATISYKNANGNVLKTVTVTLKKQLPTFPTAFQAKVNQLNAEGTLNAFMTPLGATAFDGTKDLKQSFNGLDADVNYTFIFKDAQKNSAGELEDMTIGNAYTFTVANNFINNTTKHAVEVSYNFGLISSETGFTSGAQKDYVVKGGEFKNIIFSCLAEINTYAWATAPSLTYAQTDGKTLLENIKSENKRDGKYTTTLDKLITAACDNMIQNLSGATYELWSQVAKDGAIKEGSKNEYFTPAYAASVTVGTKTGAGITFTPNSEAQNPEATVYSTLIIKAKDYFNHDVTITIKNVEVKKR